ncbi:MAG: hypothetical protein M5U34_41435 [Chloroflexi bacterium]|nr:hypothetical protein [Chloroflexota bacterium]
MLHNHVLRERQKELLYAEQELQIGHQVQSAFLPKEIPQPPGWDIAFILSHLAWLPVTFMMLSIYQIIKLPWLLQTCVIKGWALLFLWRRYAVCCGRLLTNIIFW